MLRRSSSIMLAVVSMFVAVGVVSTASTSVASAQTLSVNITTTPPGATVFVDSASTAAIGVTPLRRVRVPRGQHNFIFRLEGYQETTIPVSVTRYGQAITATLPQMARLQITAADASATGAAVSIDGEARGTIPFSAPVRPDRLQVVVTREGYNPSSQWVTLTAGQVYAWPVTLQPNAPSVGSIAIFATVRGAPVFVDGVQRCTTPCTLSEIVEGPHLVEIRPTQEGARPFTQQVTVVASQLATIDAQIEVAAISGTLRVLSTAPGATVTVDGEPIGPAPATRESLPAGDHIVEVNAPGFQRSQQTVTIVAGQQRVISVDLTAVAATSGTLRVIGTPRGAVVTVDGEAIGEIPAERAGLSAGDHIVEVTLAGYVTSTQTVTITAGQPRILSVALAESPREPGRIVVRANIPGATVLIDGESPRPVPFVQDNAPVGSHAIIVRAPGFAEFSRTCQVGPGQDCVVDADMQGARLRLRVTIQTGLRGTLFIDGIETGPVPYDGEVGVGQHVIEVRSPDYRNNTQTVQFNDNDAPRVIDVHMARQDELTADEIASREADRERSIRAAFGHTGATLPADLATVEIGVGWPYLGSVRFNMGVHENFDIGVSVRNAGRLTEFVGHVRGGYAVSRRFSVGAEAQFGGGVVIGNQHSHAGTTSNAFLAGFDARASLHVNRAAALTFNLGIDLTSDRYDYSLSNASVVQPGVTGRQTLARGRMGLVLDISLSNHDSLSFGAQGIFGQRRRVLGDMFGLDSVTYENSNLGMHVDLRMSWTHKFNWRFDDSL